MVWRSGRESVYMRTATRIRFKDMRAAGLSDTFNRANSTTTLGNADTGQAWTASSGTWGINTNQAYVVSLDTVDHVCSIEAGSANMSVSADILITSNNPGLIFRLQDATNYLMVLCNSSSTQFQIYKRVAGVYTVLASSATGLYTINTTHNILVSASGNSLSVKMDGTTVVSVTDATFNTATKVGFRHQTPSSTNTARWDNLQVTA